MIRNLKVLGLALVAVLAMSAMVASAASAASFTASGGAGTRIIASESYNVRLTITGSEVTCGTAYFTGRAPGASFTSIEVYAAFEKCKTAITSATVTNFSLNEKEGTPCRFVLYAAGTADLVCMAGMNAVIDAGPCVVHIPSQQGLGTLTYINNGGHVDIVFNLTKIAANHTDGFLCPFGSSGNSSQGVLETPAHSGSGESTIPVQPITAVPSAGTLSWDK